MDNIINFNSPDSSPKPEPTPPDYYVYAIQVIRPDGTLEVVEVTGYMIATGAFIGVCQGTLGKSEFIFISPIERVLTAKVLRPENIKNLNS